MDNNMDSMLNQAPENKCRSLGWQCNVSSCYNTLCKTDASPSGLNLFRYSQANRAKIRWRNFSKTVDGMDDFIIKILCLPSRETFYGWEYHKRSNMRRLTRGPLPPSLGPSSDFHLNCINIAIVNLSVQLKISSKRQRVVFNSFDIGFCFENHENYLFLQILSVHHKQFCALY